MCSSFKHLLKAKAINENTEKKILSFSETSSGLGYDQPSASADNANLCLNSSSYPARPHSIIV